jgi:hypothetical protein
LSLAGFISRKNGLKLVMLQPAEDVQVSIR